MSPQVRENLVGEGHEISVLSNARLCRSDSPEVPLPTANGLRHCAAAFSIKTVGNSLFDHLETTFRSAGA